MFNKYVKACESQWRTGGKRYALSEEKEYTDLICEVVGNEWIGGNILKYAGEIYNYDKFDGVMPEVDFFKIAVYSYIWWLKEFKHPTTGIMLKEKYWEEFVQGMYKLVGTKHFEGKIDYTAFIDILVKGIIPYEEQTDYPYFLMAALAFEWWKQNQGRFSSRDEGEEFNFKGVKV
jgi:hypothetical protein